jgi:hypothetical protein
MERLNLKIELKSNPNLSATWNSTISFFTSKKCYEEVDVILSYDHPSTTHRFFINYTLLGKYTKVWSLSDFDREILNDGKPFTNYGQIQGWLVNWAYSCEEGHYTDQNYDPEYSEVV